MQFRENKQSGGDQVKRKEVDALAANIESRDRDTTVFSPDALESVYYLWERRSSKNPEEFKKFYDSFNGSTLVDLASGYNPQATVDFARSHGVKKYFAVDKFNTPQFKDFPNDPMTKISVEADLLVLLSELPGNSANIALNNFDEFIFNPGASEANREYLQRLLLELARVAGKDHYIFGANSPHLKNLLGDFKNILPERKNIDPTIRPTEFILKKVDQ